MSSIIGRSGAGRGVLRRRDDRGRSGKALVGAGLTVLTLGLFTDTLAVRIGLGGLRISLLEIGVLLLGIALVVAFLRVLARKLKRKVGLGVLGAVSVGLGLPVVPALGAVLSVPVAGRLLRRLPRVPSMVVGRLSWFGKSRWERALAFVGGPRGAAAGGYGGTLLAVGAQTGKLSTEYVVFGNRLSLLALFVLLSIPGALVYGIRRK